MTTLRQLLTRSTRIIKQSSEGMPAPAAYAAQNGVIAFNAMMKELRGQQIGQKLARVWGASDGDVAVPGGLYAASITTPDEPFNGDRIGVLGICTVIANQDTIETTSSVVTTEGSTWMYREDLGDWQKEADCTLDSPSPLSEDCDEALAILLAARMVLEKSDLSQTLGLLAGPARARIGSLYRSRPNVPVEAALLRTLGRGYC